MSSYFRGTMKYEKKKKKKKKKKKPATKQQARLVKLLLASEMERATGVQIL